MDRCYIGTDVAVNNNLIKLNRGNLEEIINQRRVYKNFCSVDKSLYSGDEIELKQS